MGAPATHVLSLAEQPCRACRNPLWRLAALARDVRYALDSGG